ncbi:hypothetical protein VCHC17A1_3863B, partial [Vibrio cholerae HC-17A1]
TKQYLPLVIALE